MSNRIRNWKDFQHFKDRCPPWVKLHRSILDQRDIAVLSDGAFRMLIMLWLLASEDKKKRGELPTVEDISFRTRKPKELIEKYLKELKSFLIFDDIAPISQGCRDGLPETEVDTETKTEKEREEEAEFSTLFSSLRSIESFEKDWKEWMAIRKKKRASNSTYAKILILRELSKRINDISSAMKMAIMKSWVGFEWKWFDGQQSTFATQKPSTHLEQDGYLADLKKRMEVSK